MPPSTEPKRCSNCNRPLGAGSADGLDARCYNFRRRTGVLPPPTRLRADKGGSWQLPVRFPKEDRPAMEAAATAGGKRSVADWIRSLVSAALTRGTSRRGSP